MPRILLLLPTTTYRATDFLAAAERMHVEVVAAAEKPNVMAQHHPESLLTLPFRNPAAAVEAVREYHVRFPVDAVIPVDDDTAVLAAAIGSALSLRHNSIESAEAARDKELFAQRLRRPGLRTPDTRVYSTERNARTVAETENYPCVLKPLFLSGSRGVIRADDPCSFVAAWDRIGRILRDPEVISRGGEAAGKILVQDFVPGAEVAVEGILEKGSLTVLALFDKPEALDGPYFEETIYVTPSRHPATLQGQIAESVASATAALGLKEGPVHAELRLNDQGVWLLEAAARSIGGLCSRTLRFGTGYSLEDLILRSSLGLPLGGIRREEAASGVMMIPIPKAGALREIKGLPDAERVPGIVEITISAHPGKKLVPLPEGSSYLGFVFARAEKPEQVEGALREAHGRLEFVIDPD